MPDRGAAGWCYRAERADEVVAVRPVSDLDSVELLFLEEPEPAEEDADR
jgi:hypothetical protein